VAERIISAAIYFVSFENVSVKMFIFKRLSPAADLKPELITFLGQFVM
jgi:hypothetical protein